MKTSPAGIALIKRNEGCRLKAYRDISGVWTIGWGETGDYVYEGLVYTQDMAELGLGRRLANEFEPAVNSIAAFAPTTQPQFDAMVSLAYNIGTGRLDNPTTPQNEGRGFLGSSVARHHRAGNYPAAADAFWMWNRSGGEIIPGLVRRREEERTLYLSALPMPTPVPQPVSDAQRLREIAAELEAISVRLAAGAA